MIVIGYPGRIIVGPVRLMIDHGIMLMWRNIIVVPRTGNKPVIVNIDESGIVGVLIVVIIMYMQSAYPRYSSKMIVSDINISGLDYPSVVVVKNGHMLDLDHGTIIVVLNIRVIIIPGIEADVSAGNGHAYIKSVGIVKKVELSIGIDREFDILFNKNEWLPISVGSFENVFVFRRSYSRVSNHQEGNQ